MSLFLVVLGTGAGAASGDLDPGFASGGKYLSTLYGTSMFGPSVAVLPGGRIVVAGKHFNGADHDFAPEPHGGWRTGGQRDHGVRRRKE